MRIDFDTEQSNEPLPPGEYAVEVVEATEDESDKGNPVFRVSYEVLDGDLGGRRVSDVVTVTPQSLWRVKALLGACGLATEGQQEIAADQLLEKRLRIVTGIRTYDGRKVTHVRRYKQAIPF